MVLNLLMVILILLQQHPQELTVDAIMVPPLREDPFQFQRVPISSSINNISIVGDDFFLNGKKFQIVSGSIHYFRLPHQYWRDRLRKIKAVGFNAIATYVEWSYHEPEERQYRFTGDYDVAKFVKTAAEEGLWVLLRPGPYICAERDLGGLPYWLLSKYPNIRLRTTDADFISETRTWMEKLFENLSHLLAGNGGPIIMVQVENEYGSYSNDMAYKLQLRDIIQKHVRTNALLYTTDGFYEYMIRGGAIPGTLTTIDFGVDKNLRSVFRELRAFMPTGPLMNSEFYPGWLTHWNESLQQVDKDAVVRSLQDMLNNRISVNMYVFFGGTNFEHSAGANFLASYLPDITSYDYDAPLSEAGDPTPKYYAIRELMETYLPSLKTYALPTPSPKGAYGSVELLQKVTLLSRDGRAYLGKKYAGMTGPKLPTFERLRQRAGLMLYETIVTNQNMNNHISGQAQELNIEKPRDRVYVFVNNDFKGIVNRMLGITSLTFEVKPNSILSLLVESQGRINYGSRLHDFKGILGNVTLDGAILDGNWTVTGFPLENVDISRYVVNTAPAASGPALYEGRFVLPAGPVLDTFLDPTGWGKGYIWVNEHNLGRYWPSVGPQVTLYVPGAWLQPAPAQNTVAILELERPPPNLTVRFIDYPILNRTAALEQIDNEALIVNTN